MRCPHFSPAFRIHSNASSNLKCVTLRFVNKMDMTETLLRSIIISGIWRSIMTPTYSTMNKWSCEPLLHDQFLLSRDILLVRDPIIWYQPYLVRSRYWQVLFYSFCDITFSWTIHVLASYVNVISPRGPRVYLSVIRMDKSHSWSMLSQPTLSEYPAAPL